MSHPRKEHRDLTAPEGSFPTSGGSLNIPPPANPVEPQPEATADTAAPSVPAAGDTPTTTVDSLWNRTFLGLLLAQFTATFNDQAIHIVAIFFATDMLVRYARVEWFNEETVLSLVTACFITPFLVFSPIAGVLADKFSKRNIIVFWKLAEVVMMSLALLGLGLPHLVTTWSATQLAFVSSALVVSTTLLMGLHSTFFVPAKYGAMPEILHTTVLSRGNGLLEGTSFTAQIFGTSLGGILYVFCRSGISAGNIEPGREWMIGGLLLGLALLGTLTSFFMEPLAAADPDRQLSTNLWQPIFANLAILRRSRPLSLSIMGIAFAAFLTLFLRQTLLYEGEITKEMQTVQQRINQLQTPAEATPAPPAGRSIFGFHIASLRREEQAELRVTLLIAMVGFGVGLGSLAAGYLSGHKVELGLVPLGACGMILFSAVPAVIARETWIVVACLFLIGVSAGFYIVPLYTLLQKRAPKEAKGNLIAASNFLNVVGGILAVGGFWCLTSGLKAMQGTSAHAAVPGSVGLAALQAYAQQLETQLRIPRFLFLFASAFTVLVLFVLCRQLPDFLVRSLLWLRSQGRYHLHMHGLQYLPSDGPVILATNCERPEDALLVISATDRYVRFVVVEGPDDARGSPFLRYLSRRTNLIALHAGTSGEADWASATATATKTLRGHDVVAITVTGPRATPQAELAWQTLRSSIPEAVLLPVLCVHQHVADGEVPSSLHGNHVILGEPLSVGSDWNAVRQAIDNLLRHPTWRG
jgi:acyl-[acyl-carrier-protein]-phospholipid O-acyltransferase/long-chain-fatty-acid--[acyl-carrier-protein] ligase